MPDSVRRLAAHNIKVVGPVPDCAALFDRVRLSVAPLRFGAGVKGKVLDSLAAGVPCVMTPIAAEGMELPTVLREATGETAEALATLMVGLHDDTRAYTGMVRAGQHFVRKRHDQAAVAQALGPVVADQIDIRKRG